MKKRIFCLLLVLVFVLTSFVACGSDAEKEDKAETGETAGTETGEATENEYAEIEKYVDDLAENVNYDGETFTYIGFGYDFPTEEAITGELYNDASYQRELALEDKFGIDFVYETTEHGDVTTEMVERDVMAGSASYDLVKGYMLVTGQALMSKGCLMDVSNFQTLDLSADWWMDSLEETYAINDKLYFLTGSIVGNHFLDSACMVFSKQVAENYGITGIYDIVDAGDWTIDKMIEVASVIPTNTDGSGTWRYGMAPSRHVGSDLLFASGLSITQRDENGEIFIPEALPKELSDFADRMSAFLGDDTQNCCMRDTRSGRENCEEKYGYDSIDAMFEDDKILFMFTSAELVTNLRALDVEFGVIPEPKKDDTQADYISYGDGAGWCVYVPKVVRDVEFVDTVTEAMAALSDEYIKPAYLDKMLKGRSTDDVESRKYIDMVFNARVNDLLDVYGGGNRSDHGELVDLIDMSIENDSSGLASGYIPIAKITNRGIKSLMKQIDRDE